MTDQERYDAAQAAWTHAGGDPAQFAAFYAEYVAQPIEEARQQLANVTTVLNSRQSYRVLKPVRR